MRINNFSNAQFSDDFEFTEKSLHYQNCTTRNIDNIEKQITNNSRMVSKIQHRQNNVATTTLLFTNIQKIYQKYGATLLFLLWTLGTTFIGILAIFGTTSISILVPLAIAWFIYGIFLLWDKYSKPKDQLIEDNILSPDKPLENLPVLSRRLEIILNLLFVCGWIISLLILQYSDVRPIIYYVCCSVMATILVISIIFSKKEKTNITHIIKILLFSSLSSLSIFKIYYWSGNDTWAHAGYNEVIADIGFLTPAMGKELDYPLQHLLVVITDILPNLDVRTASLIAITVPSVLVSVTIYLIAKRLIGEKFGLVACILMNLSAYVILWRILAQTTSYGVLVTSVLLAVCFAIFLSEDKKLNSRYLILYIILIITLSLGHLFSAFIFMFIISGCWIGATLHSKSLFNKEFIILLITLFLIFVSWLLASFGFSEMVSMIHWSLTKTSETIGIDLGIESSFNMNPLSIIGNLIGYPYFLFMCCILPFIFLSTKFVHLPDKKTHLQQLLAISFGVLFTAFFITNMLGSGMQHRFMPYLGIFTAIGFAYILWYVFVKASQNPKTIKTVCLSIGIFIAAFSMINLPYYEISNDNNPYLNEKMHSLSVSSADLTALQTISTYLPRPGYSVYCDSIELVRCLAYTTYINDYKTAHVIPEQSKVGALPDWDLIDNYTDGYLILRDDLQTHSAYNRFIAASGKPYGKRTWINEAIIRNLKTNNNCIYSNNELEILTLI